MANVWEAMKKHQAEQAAREQAQSLEVQPPAPTPINSFEAQSADAPAEPTPTPDLEQAMADAPTATPTPPTPTAMTPTAAILSNHNRVREQKKTQTLEDGKRAGYSPFLKAYYDRGGRTCEEYRSLRTNLLAQCSQRGFCYMVTSALPGEGKTVTSLNLAMVLSERVDQNTLVIDADLRRRRVAELMNLKRSPGLSDYLRGQASFKEILQPTVYENFSVITAGQSRQNEVAELLGRPELEKLLGEAQQRYDYIIMDTPPINSVSDAGILGRVCNQALVVVRMNKTGRDTVERAMALLKAANIEPMGIVLTHRRHYSPNVYHYA